MNLLTDTEKNKVIKGLKTRFFVVGMFLVGVALLINAVLLVPPYLLASTKLLEDKVRAEATSLKQDTSYLDILSVPKEISLKLNVIRASIPTKTKAEILSEILSKKPNSIKIDSIIYDKPKDGEGEKIKISGVSYNRKILLDFSSELKKNQTFSEIDVPVSNLTRERDLQFVVNITIK